MALLLKILNVGGPCILFMSETPPKVAAAMNAFPFLRGWQQYCHGILLLCQSLKLLASSAVAATKYCPATVVLRGLLYGQYRLCKSLLHGCNTLHKGNQALRNQLL